MNYNKFNETYPGCYKCAVCDMPAPMKENHKNLRYSKKDCGEMGVCDSCYEIAFNAYKLKMLREFNVLFAQTALQEKEEADSLFERFGHTEAPSCVPRNPIARGSKKGSKTI